MQDIERLCKRIIIIDQGGIVFDGSLENLTKQYVKNKRIQVILADKEKVDCKTASVYGKVIECDDGKLIVEVPREGVAEATSRMIADYEVLDLEISEMDIEEIITDIFAKHKRKRKT